VDRGEDGAVEAVWISAAKGVGLDLLGRAVAERLSHGVQRMRLTLPLTEGAARARLYAAGVVLGEVPSTEGFDLTVDLPDSEVAALGRLPGTKLVPAGSDTLEFSGKTHRRQSGWR
jgi:GTP-binding protein HflX